MIFSTSFFETSFKQDRLGGVHMGGMTVAEEDVNMSRILLIFLIKKEANLFPKDFSDEEGESSLDPS